ncbi:MAG: hypothetical protein FVQ79_13165 [Planctomycetes bacterium]|nr:hypothetical protein [Planctomycetota bacterium]
MPNAQDAPMTVNTILNVGSTGSGKTNGFLTLPGKKFMYIFDPNALATLRGHDVEYELFIPEQLDLDAVTLKALNRDKFSKPPEPKTYPMFENHLESGIDSGFFDKFDVVGLDSITTLTAVVLDRILWLNSRTGEHPTIADNVATVNTVIRVFRTLITPNKTIYITGHVDYKQESYKATEVGGAEGSGKMLNVMYFLGGLRKRLPILFSEVWLSYGEPDKEEKMHYFVRTQQDRYNPYLRCSSRFIDPVEDVTVDWDKPLEGQGIGGLLERATIAAGS